MPKSTGTSRPRKARLSAKFPLTRHPSGRFIRQRRGKTYYFGRWGRKEGNRIVPVEDPDAAAATALSEYHRQWPFILRGETPPVDASSERVTFGEVIDHFLHSRRRQVDSGKLSELT